MRLAASALIAALSMHGPARSEVVELNVGEQVVIERTEAIQRVAVGNPQVADVHEVSDQELLVLGVGPGTTRILIWTGASQRREPVDVVVLPGGPLPGSLRVSSAGDRVKLAGQVDSLGDHADAIESLSAVADRPIDATAVAVETQVQIDIRIVEFSRQILEEAGISLLRNTRGSAHAISSPGNLSGIEGEGARSRGTVEGFIFESASGFLPIASAFNLVAANSDSGFIGILSLLEAHGFAHTLAEPSLVVASGRSASFLAGGEFPIPVAQDGSSSGAITIEYREFGIRLTLHPTVISRDRIVLKVAPEVSELDFSSGVSTAGVVVPALRTRRADTTVELGDGESFVIGGLVSQSTSSAVGRVPWLADVPLLGAFFRSSRFDRRDRELIMVVSPNLVRPLARGTVTPPLPGEGLLASPPSMTDLLFRGRSAQPALTGFSSSP